MKKEPGLKSKIFKGVSWMAASKIVNRGFILLTTLILARLLSPRDFGLVASAIVVFNFLTLFSNSGLGVAIAQSKEDLDEDDLSTIFWPNLLLGVILFGLSFAASSLVASFFGDAKVRPILIGLSVSLVTDSFSTVHVGYLTRIMDFRTLSIREIIASLGYGVSAVIGALLGWGAWALVFGYLVKSVLNAATLWFSVSWRPSLVFNWRTFKRIYAFGLKLVGNGFIEFFRRNTDRGLIGRILGTSTLGVYSIAYSLIMIPRDQITPLVTRVLLPAYSRIQDDNARLEKAYLRAVQYVSLVTVPVALGLAATAPELIEVLFGSKWLGAVAPLQYLSIAGALLSINPVLGYVLVAKGRPGIFVAWNFVRTLFTMGFIYLGLIWGGLTGVAAGFSLAVLLDTPITQYISIRPVGGSMRALWKAILPVFGATLLMVAAVFGLRAGLLPLGVSKLAVLILSVLAGAVIYFLALRAVRFKALSELTSLGIKLARRYTESRKVGV
ncbi:MAG: lipopolysaccharide biosynthesis protein [Patescibacteria group bacterium]|nr:MAG: lipopolysaccharide biosynthesis protein [Patescibacteria group bacterium]